MVEIAGCRAPSGLANVSPHGGRPRYKPGKATDHTHTHTIDVEVKTIAVTYWKGVKIILYVTDAAQPICTSVLLFCSWWCARYRCKFSSCGGWSIHHLFWHQANTTAPDEGGIYLHPSSKGTFHGLSTELMTTLGTLAWVLVTQCFSAHGIVMPLYEWQEDHYDWTSNRTYNLDPWKICWHVSIVGYQWRTIGNLSGYSFVRWSEPLNFLTQCSIAVFHFSGSPSWRSWGKDSVLP